MAESLALPSHPGLQAGPAIPQPCQGDSHPRFRPLLERGCSPHKGLKAGKAAWQVAAVYSHGGGVETKVGVNRAPPFQPCLGVGTRLSPEGRGQQGRFKPIGVLAGWAPASGRRKRWRSFGTSCLSSHPHPGPGRPLSNPGAQVESWGGQADEGQAVGAGRGGRGLPLVGGGLPGPGQPCAPHRLVPERAVLIDAAHSPHAAAQKTRGTARGRARRTRRDPRFPATDPGRVRPARAFPTGLKGPIPIPARGTRGARGGRGFPGRPAAGALERPSLFSLFLVTKGRPLPHAQRGN